MNRTVIGRKLQELISAINDALRDVPNKGMFVDADVLEAQVKRRKTWNIVHGNCMFQLPLKPNGELFAWYKLTYEEVEFVFEVSHHGSYIFYIARGDSVPDLHENSVKMCTIDNQQIVSLEAEESFGYTQEPLVGGKDLYVKIGNRCLPKPKRIFYHDNDLCDKGIHARTDK